jgi:hypothetical protein
MRPDTHDRRRDDVRGTPAGASDHGGSCPVCGFWPSTVTPKDAAVALRSFRRRYAERVETMAQHVDDDGELVDSVVRHVAHAADALRVHEERLRKVLHTDAPVLDGTSRAPVERPQEAVDLSAALRQLEAAADHLADVVDSVPPDDWSRKGVLHGEPVTALDLVRAAVHEGVHHLRAIDELLEGAGVQVEAPPD